MLGLVLWLQLYAAYQRMSQLVHRSGANTVLWMKAISMPDMYCVLFAFWLHIESSNTSHTRIRLLQQLNYIFIEASFAV